MYFDASLHAGALRRGDVEALRFFGVAGALLPCGEAAHPPTAAALEERWRATAAAARWLRRRGLPAWAALGVPPRCIPRRGLAERLARLPELLGRPEVAAVGPVGLWEGGALEEEVLLEQARLAAALRLPMLVRLGPGRGASPARVLALLDEAEVEPGRALIAPADARTLPALRAGGRLGLVAMAGKGGVEEAARLVRRLGAQGIVLGSGAGDGHGDLLALPRAADRMQRAGLSLAVIRRACLGNALAWLGLGADALAP